MMTIRSTRDCRTMMVEAKILVLLMVIMVSSCHPHPLPPSRDTDSAIQEQAADRSPLYHNKEPILFKNQEQATDRSPLLPGFEDRDIQAHLCKFNLRWC